MSDVFCKIAKGQLPSYKVYEDDSVMAILDIYPLVIGQTLVIPKEHYAWFYELPDELIPRFYSVVKYVGLAIKEALNPEAVAIVVRGMRIPHYHLILAPVYGDDVLSRVFSVMDAVQGFPAIEEKVLEERYRELWAAIERRRSLRHLNFDEVRDKIIRALSRLQGR